MRLTIVKEWDIDPNLYVGIVKDHNDPKACADFEDRQYKNNEVGLEDYLDRADGEDDPEVTFEVVKN
jgi:hypothetical protein